MTLKDVAQLLRRIADRGAGLSSQEEATLRTLASALDERSTDTLAQLQARLRPKRAGGERPAPANDLTQPLHDKLQELRSATVERARKLLTVYERELSKSEMISLAKAYLETSRAIQTKKAAVSAVQSKIEQRAGEEAAVAAIKRRAGA